MRKILVCNYGLNLVLLDELVKWKERGMHFGQIRSKVRYKKSQIPQHFALVVPHQRIFSLASALFVGAVLSISQPEPNSKSADPISIQGARAH